MNMGSFGSVETAGVDDSANKKKGFLSRFFSLFSSSGSSSSVAAAAAPVGKSRNNREIVLMLCLLCAVIIFLQLSLLFVQIKRDSSLLATVDGGRGPSRQALSREVASLAADLNILQGETQAWSVQAQTTLKTAANLADRIKRLQAALRN